MLIAQGLLDAWLGHGRKEVPSGLNGVLPLPLELASSVIKGVEKMAGLAVE
jgi:hypothetical protein